MRSMFFTTLVFVSGPSIWASSDTTCQSVQSSSGGVKAGSLLQKPKAAPALMQSFASMEESVGGCGPSQTVPIIEAGPTLNSILAEPEGAIGFIYIPQNGGNLIEAAGREFGLNLGKNAINDAEILKIQLTAQEVCTWNLVPPRYLAKVNIYANKPLFCVTRDPSQRLLSTYLSVIKMLDTDCPIAPEDYNLLTRFGKCSPESLNYFATEALTKRSEFAFDCNLIPQYKYIWDWDGEQVCNEIVPFTELEAGLPALLKKYNLSAPQAVPSLLQSSSAEAPCPGLTTAAFDETSTAAIREYYHKDYTLLGFQ